MKLNKALRREKRWKKKKDGMRVDSRSVFTIQEEQKKRADKVKKERRESKSGLDK